MIRTYHVLTPFNRFENLNRILGMLAGQRKSTFEIIWHPIFNDDLRFGFHFPQRWVVPGYVPPSLPFWSCWADAMNRYISAGPLDPEARYCILNDDDYYEPDFFAKIDGHQGEVIVCGMKRGDQIPPGVIAERAHGTNTLEARPEFVAVGSIGAEQMITSGRIWGAYGFNNTIAADGERIVKVCAENPVEFAPEAYVWFNYLEPGRWKT